MLDDEALERLVDEQRALVIAIADRLQHRGVDRDDLLQEGFVGLLLAARRYVPQHGHTFAAYAHFWVRNRMHALLRGARATAAPVEIAPTPEEHLLAREQRRRQMRHFASALASLDPRERAVLEARHLRQPPVEPTELAARLGVGRKTVMALEARAVSRLFVRASRQPVDILAGGRRRRVGHMMEVRP